MDKLRAVLAVGILSILVPAFSADIIVESRPEGQNYSGYSEIEGKWISSNTPADTAKSGAPGLTPQGQAGGRKTIIAVDPATPPDQVISSARFKPPVTEAGNYHVYVTFPRAANATPITMLVKDAEKTSNKQITMDGWGGMGISNSDQWIEIGTYPFTPGGDQYVELQVTGATRAADSRNPVQAYADGVRFSTEVISAGRSPAPAPASSATAPANLDWKTSIADGRAEAQKNDKQILVFFYSPASSRSTDYEKSVLNTPQVRQVIAAGYVPVKINMDTERQLAAQLEVFRAGTINIYDAATGAAVKQIGDTPQASDLVSRLR